MQYSIETVLDIGNEEFYRAARYQIPLSVLLINSRDKNIFDILEELLRPTDIIQQITHELIVVFLTHTNIENANTFVDNIKEHVNFSATVDEYKGFRVEFIQNLFKNNKKMLEES